MNQFDEFFDRIFAESKEGLRYIFLSNQTSDKNQKVLGKKSQILIALNALLR